MRVLFAGTPEFAAHHLAALLASGHQVAGVLTQPDRPAGRGRRLRPGPVKALAQEHGVPVSQPTTLGDPGGMATLEAWAPEIMVVVAYGLLLPAAVLDLPPRGCLNVHASLLPRWRGAAPIQRAILEGDTETGVSIMQMEAGLDTGPVYLQSRCPIHPTDTAAHLHDRLATLGVTALLDTLDGLAAGTLAATPQDHHRATHAPKITKAEARVDWHRPAAAVDRLVRAFNPWPVAHSPLAGDLVRIWAGTPRAAGRQQSPPGTVVAADPAGLRVATGDGSYEITRLQLPGGRPVAACDFVNAHPDMVGMRFDDDPA